MVHVLPDEGGGFRLDASAQGQESDADEVLAIELVHDRFLVNPTG
jgi:hypothetical protein